MPPCRSTGSVRRWRCGRRRDESIRRRHAPGRHRWKSSWSSGEPLHYSDIAQKISDNERTSNQRRSDAGQHRVGQLILHQQAGAKSLFVKVERGLAALQREEPSLKKSVDGADAAELTAREMGLINALGMFWDRGWVKWHPPCRGCYMQQLGSEPVNFTDQSGVYVLYDGSRVIYVGKAFDRRLSA